MGFNTVFARHRLCTSRSVINIRLDVANLIITFSVSTSHKRSSHPFVFTAMTLADGLVRENWTLVKGLEDPCTLHYAITRYGAPDWAWTNDPSLKRRLLYPLSYKRILGSLKSLQTAHSSYLYSTALCLPYGKHDSVQRPLRCECICFPALWHLQWELNCISCRVGLVSLHALALSYTDI